MFSVSGDARIIGVGNGNPTSLEPDQASERRAFNGLAQVILRFGRRPGPVIVQAVSEDLRIGKVATISLPD
jgi:beta-galactosidase